MSSEESSMDGCSSSEEMEMLREAREIKEGKMWNKVQNMLQDCTELETLVQVFYFIFIFLSWAHLC